MNESLKARLLILDDEEDMLRLLKRSLSADLDCRVDTAFRRVPSAGAPGARSFRSRACRYTHACDGWNRIPGAHQTDSQRSHRCHDDRLRDHRSCGRGNKKGAYDFITKPFEHDKLLHMLAKALERSRLVRENLLHQQRIKDRDSFQEMVGSSPKMQKIFDTIRVISKADVTVLLTGESGTGKDMAARAIHALSDRGSLPFVAVNCPNLPENILESELFGYKKGAFTHAVHDKKGLFLEAQGGTIYLDEIGDISQTLQTKLLRVLQDKEIRPLGETRSSKVDVRIIASTNRDLVRRSKITSSEKTCFIGLTFFPFTCPHCGNDPKTSRCWWIIS